MYSDEKKPENLVQVYEVTPNLEALQPKPRRPLWRRILAVFLVITGILMLRSAFVPYSCSRSYNREPMSPVYTVPEPKTLDVDELNRSDDLRRLKFHFPRDMDNFKMKQIRQTILPTNTDVFGKIYIGSCSKAENITVYVQLNASDDSILNKVAFDKKDWGLEFSADVRSLTKQFVNVTAFIVVPISDDYKLKTFQVETRELGIRLTSSFKSKINGTYFETISGEIDSYSHDLKDVLHSPYLSAKSTSGNIYGRFGLGHTLDFETTSGNIGVNITNAPWKDVKGYLKTITVSGHNKVQFANDVHSRPLYTLHRSVSGTIRVGYPEDWEGKLQMASVSGELHLVGQGTKIVKKKKGIDGRFYKAIKGDGRSRGKFQSVSGDINVGVGEFNWHDKEVEFMEYEGADEE